MSGQNFVKVGGIGIDVCLHRKGSGFSDGCAYAKAFRLISWCRKFRQHWMS
jgi:hypothetical protein